MARKYDIRRIRTATSYSVADIAELLGTHPNTVRNWIKDGLKPIDESLPALIHGAELKAFLETKQRRLTAKCSSGELYCFKCRQPRAPLADTVSMKQRSSKLIVIQGECADCGTKMHRGGSINLQSEYVSEFPQLARRSQRITEPGTNPCNCESEAELEDA